MKVQSGDYARLVLPLSPRRYKSLKESIRLNGLYNPIIVNQDGIILDGHHRFQACQELAKPLTENDIVVKEFGDELDEKYFVVISNLERRNMHAFARAWIVFNIEPIISEMARRREYGGVTLSANTERGYTEDKLGEIAGLHGETIRKVRIIRNAWLEDKQRWQRLVNDGLSDDESVSINYAYKEVIKSQKHKTPRKLPEGEFDVILADPPWDYDMEVGRGMARLQYPTMKEDDIAELQVPSATNAVLFLWATNPKIETALRVMKKWGFEYKTNIVWIKSQANLGYYVRGQHELLLIGKKGNDMPVPEPANRPSSVIAVQGSKHSEKPTIVYETIERMYPNRTYLELFARSKYSDKWTPWGLDIN